jgi:hypothetical protein
MMVIKNGSKLKLSALLLYITYKFLKPKKITNLAADHNASGKIL